ncbi:MAG: hypothetical protein LBT50_06235 [Prevotellaceae bacterium]|nr:hypothetical protein [Prevotellaceae bacterium]
MINIHENRLNFWRILNFIRLSQLCRSVFPKSENRPAVLQELCRSPANAQQNYRTLSEARQMPCNFAGRFPKPGKCPAILQDAFRSPANVLQNCGRFSEVRDNVLQNCGKIFSAYRFIEDNLKRIIISDLIWSRKIN